MIAQEKKTLRLELLQIRSKMDPKTKGIYDESICNNLKTLTLELNPAVVHAYIPMTGEINTTKYLSWCLKQGIRVICPKVLPGRKLAHLELLSLDKVERGAFDTVHPAGNKLFHGEIDIVILPGLAFDKNLYRLGYGGGYYDRFLMDQKKAKKIGVLYPFQLIDQVPVESHDEKLDQLVLP